jgi:propanol-preferring alcohol dehydrogenase
MIQVETEIPETMRAVRLTAWGSRPVLTEVPVPKPQGEEVLVRVDAAGLCQSDLHVMDAAEGEMPFALPFTLGHEVVGTVVACGPDVDVEQARALHGWPHAVHGIWSCGGCRQCERGRENYCPELAGAIGGGIGRDGGLAEYMLVPSVRHLVPAGGLDPVALAPLTDAGLTAFHAVRPHADLVRGGVVVVIGVGGLGHLALQVVAGLDPAVVVAVDPRQESRALAERLGAHTAVSSVDEVAGALAAHGVEGADVVLDFVGADETVGALPTVLAAGGQVAWVGSAGGTTLEVSKGRDLPRGWGVRAPFWGTRGDLISVVELAGSGGLLAETETFHLSDAVDAYDKLRAGEVRGRAVVVPRASVPTDHTS